MLNANVVSVNSMDYPYIISLKEELSQKGVIVFSVSVHPGARNTDIQNVFENNVVKINIAKPPDQGKANKELVRFLAELFSVPQVYVDIVKGELSRSKVIRITRV